MSSNISHSCDDIRSQKQVLRKNTRALLKALTKEEIAQQSAAVWDRLHALPLYQEARSIGLFLSMPTGEIDTAPAVEFAIQSGKEIYIPSVGTNFELADMELFHIQTSGRKEEEDRPLYDRWPRNAWGIPEPSPEVVVKAAGPGDLDLLIVPGLAFDRQGHRLGQGKGYYDRFLARMWSDPQQKVPTLIAVGLQCQLIDLPMSTIPVHEHDFPVDWVLLPNEAIQIEK